MPTGQHLTAQRTLPCPMDRPAENIFHFPANLPSVARHFGAKFVSRGCPADWAGCPARQARHCPNHARPRHHSPTVRRRKRPRPPRRCPAAGAASGARPVEAGPEQLHHHRLPVQQRPRLTRLLQPLRPAPGLRAVAGPRLGGPGRAEPGYHLLPARRPPPAPLPPARSCGRSWPGATTTTWSAACGRATARPGFRPTTSRRPWAWAWGRARPKPRSTSSAPAGGRPPISPCSTACSAGWGATASSMATRALVDICERGSCKASAPWPACAWAWPCRPSFRMRP